MAAWVAGQFSAATAYSLLALGQVASGFRRTLADSLNWMERNPGEATLYAALVAIFIWAVWRFGKS